ncbi:MULTISPECIES: GNAT family N-acetyltransferase [Streptomyces]|uniref:N-acetyltransferase n=1 Tax=Streptomyces lasiicapitis TaxID=1923961 RepID=A0ABQ2MVS7_9ACTN|nr:MULTISPECIES: GNAT family N-acetyltransferase [Streptomyces]QIB42309.1 N-acetyltransferase [Streptomyces aureoverticillatus]GGO58746.1 N-acetyltransferase [Streptomyces lasiicapitis]
MTGTGRDFDIRDHRGEGVLNAEQDGEVVGQIAYFTLGAPEPALVPVHTEVPSAHAGRGIAGALARELYATAAREGLAVVPLCPYVAKWAERHPDEAPVPPGPLVEAALAKAKEDPSAW